MIGRYSVLTAIFVAVALATGVVVHVVSGTTTYKAGCEFQMALPATASSTAVASTDVLVYNRRAALDEISRAPTQRIFAAASKATGIPAGAIGASQQVVAASDSSLTVFSTYSNPADAVKIANALCTSYVNELRKQVKAEFTAEGDQMRAQLRRLVTQSRALVRSAKRHLTQLDFHQTDYLDQAIARTKQFLAVTESTPRFTISKLHPATGASSHSTKPSLSKSLIVSAAVGLLVSFLLILLLETLRGRREQMTPPPGFPGANGGRVPPPPAPAAAAPPRAPYGPPAASPGPPPPATEEHPAEHTPGSPTATMPLAADDRAEAYPPASSAAANGAATLQAAPAVTEHRAAPAPAAAPKPSLFGNVALSDVVRVGSRGAGLFLIFLVIASTPLFVARRTSCLDHGKTDRHWSFVVPFSNPQLDRGCHDETGATVLLKSIGLE
jgi:hypothetical protein